MKKTGGFFDDYGLADYEEFEESEKYESQGYGGDEPDEDDYEEIGSEEEDDFEVLSEVEVRLAKANCYRVLLENEMFSGGDRVAAEVEREVRNFVRYRLSVLMGIREKSPPKNTAPVEVKLPFTDEQIEALQKLADKVLQRPSVGPPPQLQPVSMQKSELAKAPALQKAPAPAVAKPKPAPAPAPTPEPEAPKKRGRGRPKGSKNKPKQQAEAPVEKATKTVRKKKDPLNRPREVVKTVNPLTGKEIVMDLTPQVRPAGPIQPLPMPKQDVANSLATQHALSPELNETGQNDGRIAALLGSAIQLSLNS